MYQGMARTGKVAKGMFNATLRKEKDMEVIDDFDTRYAVIAGDDPKNIKVFSVSINSKPTHIIREER